MTAISVVIAIVFEKQIQQFVEYKKGLILKLAALLLAISFVFFASILIFALFNFLIIISSISSSILKVGNNYGTIWYIFASLILVMKPFLGNITNERFNNLWTPKELVVIVILLLLGGIYNNFFLQSP